jgi:pilus assembly protein Flp/PilA
MLWMRFLADERGATAIEYALIGTLVSLAIVSGVGSMTNEVRIMFANMAESVPH